MFKTGHSSRGMILFFSMTLMLTFGCSDSGGKERNPAQNQASGNVRIEKKKTTSPSAMQDVSGNPAFYSAVDISPARPHVKALDAVIRPVLKSAARDAKLVSENVPPDQSGDADLMDRMHYVVRQLFYIHEDDLFHKAFLKANFRPSPRFGRRPSAGSMSFFVNSGGKKYTLIVRMNEKEQIIDVKSFRIGPKDRM